MWSRHETPIQLRPIMLFSGTKHWRGKTIEAYLLCSSKRAFTHVKWLALINLINVIKICLLIPYERKCSPRMFKSKILVNEFKFFIDVTSGVDSN